MSTDLRGIQKEILAAENQERETAKTLEELRKKVRIEVNLRSKGKSFKYVEEGDFFQKFQIYYRIQDVSPNTGTMRVLWFRLTEEGAPIDLKIGGYREFPETPILKRGVMYELSDDQFSRKYHRVLEVFGGIA